MMNESGGSVEENRDTEDTVKRENREDETDITTGKQGKFQAERPRIIQTELYSKKG